MSLCRHWDGFPLGLELVVENKPTELSRDVLVSCYMAVCARKTVYYDAQDKVFLNSDTEEFQTYLFSF